MWIILGNVVSVKNNMTEEEHYRNIAYLAEQYESQKKEIDNLIKVCVCKSAFNSGMDFSIPFLQEEKGLAIELYEVVPEYIDYLLP